MNKEKKLSFLVITHNRFERLRRCLLSLSLQMQENYEVIVIDNGSAPGYLNGLECEFPKFQFLRFEENADLVVRRNQCLDLANSELCFFLDDDTELCSASVGDIAASYFAKNHSLAILSCRVIDPETEKEDYAACPRRDKNSLDEDYVAGTFSGCAHICRKSFVKQVGGYWKLLQVQVEELDLSFRLYAQNYEIIRSKDIVVAHFRERTSGKKLDWIKLQARNRGLVAVRNLPVQMVFSQCSLWWIHLLRSCNSLQEVKQLFIGIGQFFRSLPHALRSRAPLTGEKLFFLNKVSGRTWY